MPSKEHPYAVGGYIPEQRPVMLDMTKPLDTAEATSVAAWRAKRTDLLTWIDDRHGHIAAIVSEDMVKYAIRHGWSAP